MKLRHLFVPAVLSFVVPLGGCFIAPAPSDSSSSSSSGGGGSSDADTAQLDALRGSLSSRASQVMAAGVQDMESMGNTLYYRTYPTFDAQLHRKNADGTAVDYAFSIGSGDDANDRTSEDLVVTAIRNGDKVDYRAYDAHSQNASKGVSQLPAPTDEQKWWAYAVSGSTVYAITTPSEATGQKHTVYSFAAGQAPQAAFTLEDAGLTVGELWDFDVSGSTMMLIESGRLWRVDLGTKKATYMQNKTQIAGAVNFAADGVVWEDNGGLEMFDYASNSVRSITQEIQASNYRINETYKTAHYFDSATTGSNFTRYKSWVVYTGAMGIFAYDLAQKRVAPVLIDVSEQSGHRVDYRYPVVTDSGMTYVVGLTSEDGAVGADGPVYATSLAALLPQ